MAFTPEFLHSVDRNVGDPQYSFIFGLDDALTFCHPDKMANERG